MLQPSLLTYSFCCVSSLYVLSNPLESGNSLYKQNRQMPWKIRYKDEVRKTVGGSLVLKKIPLVSRAVEHIEH
jgi:hypothetical protein